PFVAWGVIPRNAHAKQVSFLLISSPLGGDTTSCAETAATRVPRGDPHAGHPPRCRPQGGLNSLKEGKCVNCEHSWGLRPRLRMVPPASGLRKERIGSDRLGARRAARRIGTAEGSRRTGWAREDLPRPGPRQEARPIAGG